MKGIEMDVQEKTLDEILASIASELSKRQKTEYKWEPWKTQLKTDGLDDLVTLRNYIQKKEKWFAYRGLIEGVKDLLEDELFPKADQQVMKRKAQFNLDSKPNSIAYGIADFKVVSKSFYIDKTQYISNLETTRNWVNIFYRPRRFGKSLFLSTLKYFYDIQFVDEFDQLFSGLNIYNDPKLNTYPKNSFLTMNWSFSELNTSQGLKEFNESLTSTVHTAIEKFVMNYEYLGLNISPKLVDGNPAESFKSLCGCLEVVQYPLYLFIDEYDTCINELLKMKSELLPHLVGHQLSLFYHLFSAIKSCLSQNGMGRVFIVGVMPLALDNFTSGFNIATDLTFHPDYNALCGFTHDELKDKLESLKIDVDLNHMANEYDGYSFSEDIRVYNSTLCLNYLQQITTRKKMKFDFDDRNVYPSSSSLLFISSHPLIPVILPELVSTRMMSCPRKNSQSTIVIKSMDVNMLLENSSVHYILAFLFYYGYLTIDYNDSDDSRTIFRIPNEITYRHYLLDTAEYYKLQEDSDNRKLLANHIDSMFNGDIEPLATFISNNMLSLLQHNDIIHSLESDVKSMFILCVVIVLKSNCAHSEHSTGGTDVDAYFEHPDPSSVVYPVVHIEFKNTTVGQIKGWYNQNNWKFMNEKSKEVVNYSEDNLFKLNLQWPLNVGNNANHLKKVVNTVGDMWDNVKAQTLKNSAKITNSHVSYAVYRIGLQRLLFERCSV